MSGLPVSGDRALRARSLKSAGAGRIPAAAYTAADSQADPAAPAPSSLSAPPPLPGGPAPVIMDGEEHGRPARLHPGHGEVTDLRQGPRLLGRGRWPAPHRGEDDDARQQRADGVPRAQWTTRVEMMIAPWL